MAEFRGTGDTPGEAMDKAMEQFRQGVQSGHIAQAISHEVVFVPSTSLVASHWFVSILAIMIGPSPANLAIPQLQLKRKAA